MDDGRWLSPWFLFFSNILIFILLPLFHVTIWMFPDWLFQLNMLSFVECLLDFKLIALMFDFPVVPFIPTEHENQSERSLRCLKCQIYDGYVIEHEAEIDVISRRWRNLNFCDGASNREVIKALHKRPAYINSIYRSNYFVFRTCVLWRAWIFTLKTCTSCPICFENFIRKLLNAVQMPKVSLDRSVLY